MFVYLCMCKFMDKLEPCLCVFVIGSDFVFRHLNMFEKTKSFHVPLTVIGSWVDASTRLASWRASLVSQLGVAQGGCLCNPPFVMVAEQKVQRTTGRLDLEEDLANASAAVLAKCEDDRCPSLLEVIFGL